MKQEHLRPAFTSRARAATSRTAIATARVIVAVTHTFYETHRDKQHRCKQYHKNKYFLYHNHLHSPEHSESGVSNSKVAWMMPISASLPFNSPFKCSISDRLSTTT